MHVLSTSPRCTASERAIAYVMRYTKAGPLRELCLEMIRTSQRFWTAFFDYLNNNLERLIQFRISDKECLVLVSEQMQIVFEQVFIKRMMMPEFSVVPGTKVLYDYAAQIFLALPATIWAWILHTLWGKDGGKFVFIGLCGPEH
jgi:hypothetical protein